MTDDVEARRRRAGYRASHLGTNEMDFVLGRFADAALPGMTAGELAVFEELLALPDPVLHEMVMDGVPAADDEIVRLIADIRAFHGLGADASPSPRPAGRGSG
jgi:antitoxin CptB